MACTKVLATSGNISLRNLVTAAYLKLLLTPASLLVKRSLPFDICYVDDLIFGARNEKDIVEFSIQLCAEGVGLEQEVDAAGFAGIHFKCNPKTRLFNMV